MNVNHVKWTLICVSLRLDWMDTCTRCLKFLSRFLSSVTWSNVFQNDWDFVKAGYNVCLVCKRGKICWVCNWCLCFLLLWPPASHTSLTKLSDMSENEDVLLEFFVTLPQLKQVTSDKEELVTSIVNMASKLLPYLTDTIWTRGFRVKLYKHLYVCHL